MDVGVRAGVRGEEEGVKVGGKEVKVGEGMKIGAVVIVIGWRLGAGAQAHKKKRSKKATKARFIIICRALRGDACTPYENRCCSPDERSPCNDRC